MCWPRRITPGAPAITALSFLSFFIDLDIDQSIQNTALQFQKQRADPFATPVLKGRLTDIPSLSEGSLLEMNDFHAGLRTGGWKSMKLLFHPQAKPILGRSAVPKTNLFLAYLRQSTMLNQQHNCSVLERIAAVLIKHKSIVFCHLRERPGKLFDVEPIVLKQVAGLRFTTKCTCAARQRMHAGRGRAC